MKRNVAFPNIPTASAAPSHSSRMPFITGVLKQRYADFQVYEINRDNQKAVIDSLLKRSLKKKRGSESNETDTGKSSNKRPRNIDKITSPCKEAKGEGKSNVAKQKRFLAKVFVWEHWAFWGIFDVFRLR